MSTAPTDSPVADSTLSEADVEKLWKAFSVFDTDKSGAVSVGEMGAVMRSLGQNPSAAELRSLLEEVDIDRSGSIDFGEFKTLMISRHGDRRSRLELAFGIFDKDGGGHITAAEMSSVMSQVGLTTAELDAMVKEVDDDGDGSIDFAEFCKLAPAAPAPGPDGSALGSIAMGAPLGNPAATAAAIAGAVEAREQLQPAAVLVPTPDAAAATVEAELTLLRDQIARQQQEDKVRGTSILQFQIG